MQQKIIKTGNSLSLTIPADFVKVLGLQPGQTVETKADALAGTVTHHFSGSGQLNLLTKKH
jgi:antitoxin component of MazEF toxin-antitoxin module